MSRLAPISYTDVCGDGERSRSCCCWLSRPSGSAAAVRGRVTHTRSIPVSADSGQHTYIVVLTYLGIYERRTLVINYQNNHGICCISAGVHAAHSAPDAATSMITRQTHDPLWL